MNREGSFEAWKNARANVHHPRDISRVRKSVSFNAPFKNGLLENGSERVTMGRVSIYFNLGDISFN